VSADGSRFVVIKVNPVKAVPVTQLNLISDWTSAVEGVGGPAKR
jgi:hypothetical protein